MAENSDLRMRLEDIVEWGKDIREMVRRGGRVGGIAL